MELNLKGTQILFDRDTTEGIEYVGIAASGTTTATAQWQIKAIALENDKPVSIKFAEGTADAIHKWDDRATLAYS